MTITFSTIRKIFCHAGCILLASASMAKADFSSTVTRGYDGTLSIARTVAHVQTEALLKSHGHLLRQLAREPVMQQIKTVTPVFSPPDVNGLVYSLYDFPFDYLVDPMTKTITGFVTPKPRFTELREAVLRSLPKRSLMEHYGAVLTCQKSTLRALNRLLESGHDTLPLPGAEGAAFLQQEGTQHGGACPLSPQRTKGEKSESNYAHSPHQTSVPHNSTSNDTASGPATISMGTAPQSIDKKKAQAEKKTQLEKEPQIGKASCPVKPPQAPPVPGAREQGGSCPAPQSPQALTDTLAVLLCYQILLQKYDTVWQQPEAVLKELTELEAMDADNPLIHGALAEVLLQLKKPQQAQHHSDRALASTQEYAYLHDTRGQIYLQLHLPALATDAFTNALALDIHNPLFHAHRGTSYLMRNKLPSMCRDFDKACVLGDCSGSQWAHAHGLCGHEDTPLNDSPPPSPGTPAQAGVPDEHAGHREYNGYGNHSGQQGITAP